MPSPDPARIDALLGGDPPRDAEEQGLTELVSALRATEGASDALRARVTALTSEPAPAKRLGLLSRLRGTTWGRVALVAAPVCALAIAAVVSVEAFSGADEAASPVAATGAAPPSAATAEGTAADTLTSAPSARLATGASVTLTLPAGVDLDTAGARTRRIAQDLGGVATAERYEVTPGAGGTAVLTLRIPSGRLDAARARLARLGAVRRQTLDYVTPPPSAAPPVTAPAPAAAPPPADGLVTVRVTLRAR